ncbi:MAG: BrnT family toxin [Rhizomicrobium sp.]
MSKKRRFEWHRPKAEANIKKHKVSFDLGELAFDDPFAQTELEGHEHGEERWRTVGAVGSTILIVIHTSREEDDVEIIRIISVRKAEPRERRKFEDKKAKR